MYGLLDKDEEVDAGVFPAYLRAQSDADLLDILGHLDPERYPYRVDAVRRETLRRHVLPIAVHTTEERFIRGFALLVCAIAGVLVTLTICLTPADIVGPAWPTDEMLTDGTLVSTVMRLTLVDFLRCVVVGSVRCGAGPLALLILGGWLIARAGRRGIRGDVKRLALLSTVVFVGAVCIAAAPASSVPGLLTPTASALGFGSRLLTLLCPG